VIRAVLGTGGRPPLQAPGLDVHEKLTRLDETVAGALERHDSPLARQLSRHLHRAVTRSHRLAETVARLNRFVKRAARILGRKGKASDQVKADFEVLLERIRTRLRQPRVSAEEGKALRKMLSSSDYYGEKLFTCYDHERVPRTNNDHEHMYGRLRGNERRVTGHRSTSRTVRDGRFTAPVIERIRRGDVPGPEELGRVSREKYEAKLEEMKRARERHARPRNIRKRFDEVLERLASRGRHPGHNSAAGPLDRRIPPP